MPDPVCEYCEQDPCDCPVFDLPEEPDEVGDENDEGPRTGDV